MMQEWLNETATPYLRRLLEIEDLPSEGQHCQLCQSAGNVFRCQDCLQGVLNAQIAFTSLTVTYLVIASDAGTENTLRPIP